MGEGAGDGFIDFGVPDGFGVEDVLDGEVRASVSGEQRPRTLNPYGAYVGLITYQVHHCRRR